MQEAFEAQYHRLEETHWWFRGRREMVRSLVKRIQPDRQANILEIGCSGGVLIRQLRADGYQRVTGIDISPDAIAICLKAGLDAQLMDASRLAFPADSFDVITASDILEHLADETQALREWGRVLKPGGALVIFVPAFQFLWSHHDTVNKHFRRYTRAGLIQVLQTNGFKIERGSYWNVSLFLPVAAVRMLMRKMSPPGRQGEVGDLEQPPALANEALIRLLALENRCLRLGFNAPWGVSVMVLARKPQPG